MTVGGIEVVVEIVIETMNVGHQVVVRQEGHEVVRSPTFHDRNIARLYARQCADVLRQLQRRMQDRRI